MGAETFTQTASGGSPAEAFDNAKSTASHEYGHGGYTGSIAEKYSFIVIEPHESLSAYTQAYQMVDNGDPRISDKWGPAGCIQISTKEYLFFGWASS